VTARAQLRLGVPAPELLSSRRFCSELSAGNGILLPVMDAQIPRRAQDRVRPRPFAHLDAPLHELYRAIMTVFRDSKQRFVVHLRPEDVAEELRRAAALPAGQEQVDEALVKLEEWGNLRANPDTSRVTTVEDFYRTRYLYQLSREGEAAERALEVYEREMARRAELQAVALEDIRLRLRALRGLPAEPDPAVVHSLLLELSGRLDSLAANATAFMGSLQRTIELQDVDEETFLAYKDRLISYLERFVSELVVKSHDIAATLRGIDAGRADQLLLIAAHPVRSRQRAGPEPAGPRGARPRGAGPRAGARPRTAAGRRPLPTTRSRRNCATGRTGGPACGPGSWTTGRTRARRPCCASGPAGQSPNCSARSACCRSGARAAATAAPTSARSRAGSPRLPTPRTRTGSGGRRSASRHPGISPARRKQAARPSPPARAGWMRPRS
jgi:hypothetical protein